MKAYITATSAISAQHSFGEEDCLQPFIAPEKQYLTAIEPDYRQYIDPKLSRRMARIIKMSVATAKKSLEQSGVVQPAAITVGTGLGCLQDTEKFLAEIVETAEGLLSPTAFIQSTHNTIAGQIALMLGCPQHNFTFVQRAFSFENALEDALLQLSEGGTDVLLGGVDEITPVLYQILEKLQCAGRADERGSLGETSEQRPAWGEGATFFVLSRSVTPGSLARVEGVSTFFLPAGRQAPAYLEEVQKQANLFLQSQSLQAEEVDALMLGYNGCAADNATYDHLRHTLFPGKPVLGFKQLCGEYFTASAFGLHLAAKTLQQQRALPGSLLAGSLEGPVNRLLLYNHSQGKYHSFILISACKPS